MSPLFDEFHEKLRKNPDQKWGFIVYRCTYGDDAAWQSFLDRLKLQARLNLEGEGAEDIIDRIGWDVQGDPSLDGAKPAQVKVKFREWIAENYPNGGGYSRTYGCIMVDKESLDSAKHEYAPPADECDDMGWTWVWMVGSDKEKTTKVGISYLLPRAYLLISAVGWHRIVAGGGSVATP